MWRSRMFWRLFGTFGLLILASTSLLGVVLVNRVEKQYLRQLEAGLRVNAVLVRDAVRGRSPEDLSRLRQRVAALRDETGLRITLLAEDGRVLADSDADPAGMDRQNARPEIRAARENTFGARSTYGSSDDRPMMYVALWAGPDSGPAAFVRVASPLGDTAEQLARLHRIVWITAAGTCLAAMALAFWLARRIVAPLRELIDGAARLAAGEYGHKVYAIGGDETGALARAFNHMNDQLTIQFVQLKEDREQLRTILSGMVEGVVALDAEQRILFANRRAAELLAFQGRMVVGRKLWEIVRLRPLQQVVERALEGAEPGREEFRWDGPDTRSLAVHAARLPGTPPRGAVVVFQDTTELRRLERLRQDFVANVSHELKTPLSIIKLCVETLLDGAAEDPAPRGQFLKQVADQAERLHLLILDLLSLARIESGEEAFDFGPVPLDSVIALCLQRHRARAAAKNQLLHAVNPPPGAGTGPGECLTAWADEEAIGQILDNLVDNAVKYTPPGGTIWVRWRPDGDHVCLEVEDTGIGIPEQDLPRIFERFYRVDKARSRELGGTGLGLSIVKHLVGAMRGTISATSQVNRGTRFTVRLPCGPAA